MGASDETEFEGDIQLDACVAKKKRQRQECFKRNMFQDQILLGQTKQFQTIVL